MSKKINPKDLTYQKKLPPFLAALQGQVAGNNGPDPILTSHRRAVKPRSKSEEAEDAPLVLDENGDAISGVTVGADGGATMAASASDDKQGVGATGAELDSTVKRDKKDAGAAIFGGSKKRKVGKMIGSAPNVPDEEDDTAGGVTGAQSGGSRKHKNTTKKSGHTLPEDGGKHSTSKGKHKSVKKIKLSFEDEEDG